MSEAGTSKQVRSNAGGMYPYTMMQRPRIDRALHLHQHFSIHYSVLIEVSVLRTSASTLSSSHRVCSKAHHHITMDKIETRKAARRVLIIVSRSSPHWPKAWSSSEDLITVAGRPMENKVNGDIRALHNATGLGSRPPFEIDHSDGKVPFYPNPRTSVLVQAGSPREEA